MLSDKTRVYNVHFCVLHVLIFPVSVFLFSFTHFLSTKERFPLLFPILQFSRDQMYEKIHHRFLLHVCPPGGGGNSLIFLCPPASVWTGGSPCLLYRCCSGISFCHSFISVLCCIFSFLDSVSSFFFVYFPVPVEVNCFGNHISETKMIILT